MLREFPLGCYQPLPENDELVTRENSTIFTDRRKQFTELVLRVFAVRHGVPDFQFEQDAITPSQAVHGCFYRAFGHLQLAGNLMIRSRTTLPGQIVLQHAKYFRTAAVHIFGLELLENSIEQRQGPTSLKESFRGQRIRRLRQIAAFRILKVQRKVPRGAATPPPRTANPRRSHATPSVGRIGSIGRAGTSGNRPPSTGVR